LSQDKIRVYQSLIFFLVLLFSISGIISLMQYSTLKSFEQQLGYSDNTIDFLQKELIASQNQLENLSSYLNFYKQLSESYMKLAERYSEQIEQNNFNRIQ
jgi:hypothetical protein